MKFISFNSCQGVLIWTNHLNMMKGKSLMPFRCLLWEGRKDCQDKNNNKKNPRLKKKPKNIIKNIWKETTYAATSFYFLGQNFMSAVSWNECVGRNLSPSELGAIGNMFNTLISFIQIISVLRQLQPLKLQKMLCSIILPPPSISLFVPRSNFQQHTEAEKLQACQKRAGNTLPVSGCGNCAELKPGISGHCGGHFTAPLLPLCFLQPGAAQTTQVCKWDCRQEDLGVFSQLL